MATIGLLTYTLPPGLKVKNAFSEIPINGSNILGLDHQNSIVTKIENIGMIGGEVVVVRKKQMPLAESNIGNIQQAPQQGLVQEPPAKKPKFMTGEITTVSGKKAPQPQAVARRNARERRRVKQVNDGFTTLRQHIPDEVAAAFEAAGNGRGTAKKLSKVETLRMAVEYIRSLERLLEIDSSDTAGNVDIFSNTVIKSESCSPPLMLGDGQCSESSYDPSADESATIYYTDTLPDITTLNGQQYIRIPGTNTYQLITPDVFENEENIHPQVDVSYSEYTRAGVTDQHTAIASASAIIAPAPISPPPSSSDFNDSGAPPQSISPASSILDTHHHQQQPTPLQQRLHDHLLQQVHVRMIEDGIDGRGARIKCEDHSFNIYQSHLAPSSSPINDIDAHGYVDAQLYEGGGGMLHLKREVDDDDDMAVLDTTGAVLSEESMIESIDWWHDHTPQSDDSAIIS